MCCCNGCNSAENTPEWVSNWQFQISWALWAQLHCQQCQLKMKQISSLPTSSPPRFPVEMQLGRRDYHRDCQTPLGLMLEVNMWSVFFHRSWWHCDNFNGENWLQGVASTISRFWSVFDLIARQMIRSIGSCLRSATKQMTRFLTQRQFSDKPGIGARYIDFKQVVASVANQMVMLKSHVFHIPFFGWLPDLYIYCTSTIWII